MTQNVTVGGVGECKSKSNEFCFFCKPNLITFLNLFCSKLSYSDSGSDSGSTTVRKPETGNRLRLKSPEAEDQQEASKIQTRG